MKMHTSKWVGGSDSDPRGNATRGNAAEVGGSDSDPGGNVAIVRCN